MQPGAKGAAMWKLSSKMATINLGETIASELIVSPVICFFGLLAAGLVCR